MSSLCCHQSEEQVTNREPRVVLILHEITRLKQTTAALKKKKKHFYSLLVKIKNWKIENWHAFSVKFSVSMNISVSAS